MRLLEFAEAKKPNKTVEFIKANCSDILKVYQKTNPIFLYRGIGGDDDQDDTPLKKIIRGNSPIDREPLSTDPRISELLDTTLTKAGFSAIRSNSIFCVGNEYTASNYGDVYVIFPVNGFTYSWCATAEDLTSDYELEYGFWGNYYKSHDPNDLAEGFVRDLVTLPPKSFVKKYQFISNRDIITAIKTGKEVLIHGKYVAISVGNENILAQILGKPKRSTKWSNMPEDEQISEIKKDWKVYLTIKNPSERVQIAAVQIWPNLLRYMDNPKEAVQLAAVKRCAGAFQYLKDKNPSEAVQLLAVKKDPFMIEYVKNPSEALQLIAVRKDIETISSIKNPTEKIQMMVINLNPSMIRHIAHPTEQVQFKAIQKDPEAWRWLYDIRHKSQRVQALCDKRHEEWIKAARD
jgi:hypothetical protein